MMDCDCPECTGALFPLTRGEIRLIYLIAFFAAGLATWAWRG